MFKVYKKLLYYVPRERYLAYIAIIGTALGAVLTIGSYYYLNEFLKKLLVTADAVKAEYYALLIVGLSVTGGLLYFVAVLLCHVLGFRLETNLRKRGIDGLVDSSFRFYDLNSSGRTRKIIDDNASQTHTIVAHLIPDISGALLTPCMLLVLGFLVSWRVGALMLIICLISGALLGKMSGDKAFMKEYQNALEKLSSETVEYIRGIQVVKIFGAKVSSFKELHRAIKSYSKKALDYSMSCRGPFVVFQLMFFALVPIIIPLVVLFIDRTLSPEMLAVELIMTLFLSGVMFISIMKVMYVSMYSFQGTTAVDKLEEIFHEMGKDKLDFGKENRFENFRIEFDNVTFGYGDKGVLENLSFTLEEGKQYALMGDSGSGKSTIAKLLSGFYKIDGGTIKIGGKALGEYTEESIIKNIAFVFQDAKLFKTSIYENVLLARPTAKRDEVMEALRLAGCQSIMDKFSTKENTIIGSKGVYLSGGEKQRIAIARAILKDAGIIILDEASAAVDPDNEHELQKAFAHLMKGKTVIMIAHRLSSIRNVDEILVMEKGKIIERGTDEELMSTDTRYKELQNLYGQANQWRVNL